MVFKYGAQATYYQLISDKYKQSKKVSLKVINKLANTQIGPLQKEIEDSCSTLITSEDSDWPTGVNDLESPPIALLIKGKRETLRDLSQSISIVGSRRPTSYGNQIATFLARKAA
ncbi:MAG: DNA-protecting protein DprA, partial [Actinobacteria bacterium]|nr:DNA-protecting protein DprA [Actinomycetota bacterium]